MSAHALEINFFGMEEDLVILCDYWRHSKKQWCLSEMDRALLKSRMTLYGCASPMNQARLYCALVYGDLIADMACSLAEVVWHQTCHTGNGCGKAESSGQSGVLLGPGKKINRKRYPTENTPLTSLHKSAFSQHIKTPTACVITKA